MPRPCMPRSRLWLLAALAAAGLSVPPVHAAAPDGFILADASGITVDDAWARASAGATTTGAAYVKVKGGAQADQLIGASTPVAKSAEVHQTSSENGVMRMRAVPGLPIPPGQVVTFAPGGTHIMLMGLKQPLVAGQSFPLTLNFAHSAPVTVDVRVEALGHNAAAADHGSMQMH